MKQEFTLMEKISILESMQARECLMLIAGTPYLTGSDYSNEMLNKTIEELENSIKVKAGGSIYHFGNVLDDKIFCDR